ncbi:MAG: chitobiase/beta-hexosaminidase C-terminal domain-containing protein [Eubacterium sp.]
MKCSKCGAEIRPGCIYCSSCGQEAQIVTEINVLEEDLLRSMLEEENSEKQREEEQKQEQEKQKRLLEKRQKKAKKTLLFTILILIIACAAALGVVKYRQSTSIDYLMGKAQKYYREKNYQDAVEYLEKALQRDPENEEALLLKGDICVLMKEDEAAETIYTTVIARNPKCEQAYKALLSLYDRQGEYAKIVALEEEASEAGADDAILTLFSQYIVPAPVFDQEEGTYDKFLEIQISSKKNNTKIYYTLDGSEPSVQSEKYEDSIELTEQGEFELKAVCCDENGNLSDVTSAKYVIKLPKPDMPGASPDGGQFTEPRTITVTVPEGVDVYYTWDGSTPTENSSKYRKPISVPEGNNILSLIAVDENGMKSDVLKCNYIYYPE